MKILIFTEGTILMHASAKGLTREQRVEQSKTRERSTRDYHNYLPNGNPANKILKWKKQGAEIYYLTSRTIPEEVADIKFVLKKFNFPDNQNLLFKDNGEEYEDIAEKLLPDIITEDDCESIGGEKEMVYPNINPQMKIKIKSIIVKEFEGIDHLPDKLET